MIDPLRCEFKTDPLGIDTPHPRLSWRLPPASKRGGPSQSAYRLIVATAPNLLTEDRADLWDTGKILSDQSVQIPYAGKPLRSGRRAWWKVRVWDERRKPMPWSDPAFWEMGLLSRDDWQCQWIGSSLVGGAKTEIPLPLLRKSFTLPRRPIASARLYVTALGLYEFHLNGCRVGEDVFTPGWTDYRRRVQYQVYDVASLLHGGENAAGAILADGWYCGFIGNLNRRQYFGDRPKLLAQILVHFADGSSQLLVTDGSWRVTHTGPYLAADLMMGQTYDARLEIPGWDRADFNDAAWQSAVVFPDPAISICAMPGPPVRAIQEICPISISRQPDRQLVDLGQNMVGRLRLRLRQPRAGQTITLRFGEVLDKQGRLYTANLRAARQTDHYTMRGNAGPEIFEPRFTFHGFRYVEIARCLVDLTAEDITGVVLHSQMDRTGDFTCSDPLVNQLQHNIQWGQKGNFIDVPTDCPQRDERLGWTGDAQVFVRTAAFNHDVAGFFTKWLGDLADAQGKNGGIPSVAPWTEENANDDIDGGPAWSDAFVICPWTIYLCYGDRTILQSRYAAICRFVEFLRDRRSIDLIRSHPDLPGFAGFGDWLAPDSGRQNSTGLTPKDLIGAAFLAHSARLLSRIAQTLGHRRDHRKYNQLANNVTQAFNDHFVTPKGLLAGNTQTAYVLALHFNLLPPRLRQEALRQLVRLIEQNGNRLATGFVGTPYLLHVLADNGRLDLAYKLLLQRQCPGWLYPVTHGATTIWERWDGWTEEHGFQDPGMNSFNHYAYGAVGDWLYQVVAGINVDPQNPGYKHILLNPRPGGGLTHAAARLQTQYGPVASAWRIEPNKITYEFEIPPNTTATARLPSTDPRQIREAGKRLDRAPGVKLQAVERDAVVLQLRPGRYRLESPFSLSRPAVSRVEPYAGREGRGEGDLSAIKAREDPHLNPLPPYRERRSFGQLPLPRSGSVTVI